MGNTCSGQPHSPNFYSMVRSQHPAMFTISNLPKLNKYTFPPVPIFPLSTTNNTQTLGSQPTKKPSTSSRRLLGTSPSQTLSSRMLTSGSGRTTTDLITWIRGILNPISSRTRVLCRLSKAVAVRLFRRLVYLSVSSALLRG